MSAQENSRRFVNVYDIDDNGNYVLLGRIDVALRKECPNCFVMFNKKDNLCFIQNSSGNVLSRYYKCPACGCRIKTYDC